jgi:hypothetical protein
MESSDLITDWTSNWFCYWDGSFATPLNQDVNYVFKPPLTKSSTGVIRFCGGDPADVEERAIGVITSIQEKLTDARILCSCFGSESDYPFYPLLHSAWQADKPLTPQTFLENIGAHPELMSSIQCDSGTDITDNEDDVGIFGELNSHVYEMLTAESHGGVLTFYCGSEKMNPVPLFVLCKFSDTVVGGFLSAIVHT